MSDPLHINLLAGMPYAATVLVHSQTERTIQLVDPNNNNDPLLTSPFKGNVLSNGNSEEGNLGTTQFTTETGTVAVIVTPTNPSDVIQILKGPDGSNTQFVVVSDQSGGNDLLFNEVVLMINGKSS